MNKVVATLFLLSTCLLSATAFAQTKVSPCEQENAQADPNNQGCEANTRLSIIKTALLATETPRLPEAAALSSPTETPFSRPTQGETGDVNSDRGNRPSSSGN